MDNLNENVKRLMLEAGYAAPEIAGRAHQLTDLIVDDVISVLEGLIAYHQITLVADTTYKIHNLASLKEAIGHIKRRYGRE